MYMCGGAEECVQARWLASGGGRHRRPAGAHALSAGAGQSPQTHWLAGGGGRHRRPTQAHALSAGAGQAMIPPLQAMCSSTHTLRSGSCCIPPPAGASAGARGLWGRQSTAWVWSACGRVAVQACNVRVTPAPSARRRLQNALGSQQPRPGTAVGGSCRQHSSSLLGFPPQHRSMLECLTLGQPPGNRTVGARQAPRLPGTHAVGLCSLPPAGRVVQVHHRHADLVAEKQRDRVCGSGKLVGTGQCL